MAVLAAAAVVVPGHLAGEAFAQSPADSEPVCPSAASGEDCVYHVTEALAVRDIRPHAVRVDPDTGYVYVATEPNIGSRDLNYSYLSAYNSSDNGYLPIAEFRFDVGINTRIAAMEINNRTNELHVVHLYGMHDASEGWMGDNDDTRGKANLTTIDLDTHQIAKTIRLEYEENPPRNASSGLYDDRFWHQTDRFWIPDMALDTERDLAYIGAERAPIMVVDTSTTTLLPARVDRAGTTDPGDGWNAFTEGTISMSMAVDEESGLVYAGAVVGDKTDTAGGHWGIAVFNFTDAGGSATANYTRQGFLNVSSNPPPDGTPDCGNNFYSHPCYNNVRIVALHLDADNSKLFALYGNHTVWAVRLGADMRPQGMDEVHIRTPDEAGRAADKTVYDIVLDARRGLLYASLYDYTDPRVVVIESENHGRVGVASTTSQTWHMGVNDATGAVYVLPQWALGAYAIEGEPKSNLQRMIDAASDGDTIVVEPGIYDDTVLDIDKPLTLTSPSGQPGPAKFTGYSRIEIEADDVTVKGLSFENTDCMPGYGGSLVEIRTHHNVARERVTIENNVFRDTCHAAIQKEGRGNLNDITITGNTFVNIGLKVPPGWTEPLDTGGENEFQITHGAIGLAHHPNQNTVGGTISNNFINGTSAAGIRVFNADDMTISNNYIANTPASAIGLAHNPRNVQVTGNTIVNANSEPDLDYLAGIEGSGDADYWRFFGPKILFNMDSAVQTHPTHGDGRPAPDAAINVWSDGENIRVEDNTIRESDGAFTVCAGICAFESDGLVRAGNRNIPDDKDINGANIVFRNNLVYAHSGPDNNGTLIRSEAAAGTLDASGNAFPGHTNASDVPVYGNVNLATTTVAAQAAPAGESAQCPSSADADRCTYHATGSFTAGDVSPALVRIDHERGIAYVASKINAGAANPEEVVLLAYELDAERGYPLAKAFDPVGSHYPRIPAMEIDVENRALYVIHAWNHSYRIGEIPPQGVGSHTANVSTLSRINLDSMEFEWTTPTLNHTNRDGEANTHYDLYDIALDPENKAAFIMTEGNRPDNPGDRNASPVLVVNTNNGTLHPAVFRAERHPYNYTQDPDAVLALANPSAMASNLTDSHTAYLVGRIGTHADPHWGVATVSFEGPEGEVHPDYEVHDFVTLIDNPDNHRNYQTYRNGHESYNSVLARDVILDDENDALYVLMRNGSLYRYNLGTDTEVIGGDTIGLPRSPEKVAGLPGDIQNVDFDARNGMLYAVSFDWQRPSVYAIRASDAAVVGESSLNDQMIAISVDRGNGTVYVSPSWTPSVYVIDPMPRTGLQNMITAAAAGSVVTIPDGAYDDTVLVVDKDLTLTSTTGEAGPARFTGHSRIQVQSSDVTIRGLLFENTDCMPGLSYNHIGIHNKQQRSGITIENNRFEDTCHAAVQTKGANTLEDVKVRFNSLENVGTKIAPGKSEPLDTGGEDEWLYTHGGIGLSYHPGQQEVRNADISYNDIRGTSSAGIRVFNPDDVRIVGNYIRDTPEAGIALAHNRNYDESDVLIRANTIVAANTEPDMDYLDGVEGSGELSYYEAVGLLPRASLTGSMLSPHYEKPTPSAAIKVWANLEGVTVADNAISGSGGAFVACAGTCATESDGVIHTGPDNRDRWKVRNILLPVYDDGGFDSYSINVTDNRFAFNWNVISADNDRSGSDLIANNATGVLDATNNYYPGMIAADQIRSPDTVDYATAARSIASVAPASDPGAVGIGGTVGLEVKFSRDTIVDTLHGEPLLVLSTGGTAAGASVASFKGASGGRTLAFEYTVGEGDRLDLGSPGRMALNGALIDAEPNPGAVLELPPVSNAAALAGIDSVRPYVVNVTAASPAGTYYTRDTVEIVVSFSEPVVVDATGGTLALPLEAGRAGAAATYAGGAADAGRIAFEYAVQGGDMADPLTNAAAADLILGANSSIRDMAGNDAVLALPGPGTNASLGETSGGGIVVRDRATTDAAADAVFTARNTIRIDYTGPVGPPANYTGDVYGTIALSGGSTPLPTAVSGLGSATHTVQFGGPGVSANETGTIALNTDLEGRDARGTPQRFADDLIPIRAGALADTVRPTGTMPVVAIEPDGFVRRINVVDGDEAVRPALNVSALAVERPGGENATSGAANATTVVRLPATDTVAIVASFAEVHFPPNVTATMVPADGLLELYVAADAPTVEEAAAALGAASTYRLEVRRVVEIGDNETHIEFDIPVRIVLDGQAGGVAYYMNNTDDSIVLIDAVCAADDTAAVHAQLGGSGECALDSGGDKVIHTYHLTRFGTIRAATGLEAAVSEAEAGSTIRVAPGTYPSSVLLVDRPLTIEAADPADPPVFTGYSHIVVRPSADGPVAIRNLSFMNTSHTSGGGGLASIIVESQAGSAARGAPVAIEGNSFRNTCDSAIRVAAGAGAPPVAGLAIENNRFYGIGSNTAGCMSASAPDRADAIVAGRHGQFTAETVELENATMRGNYIFGTTYTGIRVAGADGLVVEGNHIEGVPDDAIRVLPSRNVEVRDNTIVSANTAPHTPEGRDGRGGAGDPGAAIVVWSGSDDVAVTLNRIIGGTGAFSVCAGSCYPGADAADGTGGDPVPVGRAQINSDDGANDIRFNHNTISPSTAAPLVSNAAEGTLAARSNYYPGRAASVAAGNGIAAAEGAAIDYLPALADGGPARVGVVVADAPGSSVRSIDAAVAAGFAAGADDYNEEQARAGGTVAIVPVVESVRSPDVSDSAAHEAALASLRTGASDERMRPVLENSIARAIALYDADRTAGLDAITAMASTYGHYPFVTTRSGTIVAHGANASLVGRADIVPAIAGGADGLRALYDFGDADAMAGIEGYPSAAWKWWTYEFANPAAGGAPQSKRSMIVLHAGPDGEAGTADDLVFGAGYYPPGAPSHLFVAAGDAAAAADPSGASGVVVSPTSTATAPPALASADALFRLAPPDAAAARAIAGLLGGDIARVVVLNDSASLQSMSMAAALSSPLSGVPTSGRAVEVVQYDSSSAGEWAGPAMDSIAAAVGPDAQAAAVVYTGRAGALAELAGTPMASSAPPARWYATGDLARAELGAPAPDLARRTGLTAVSQYAAPSAAVDAALAGIALDDSTRGPAYAAYDAPFLLGSAIAGAGSATAEGAAPAAVAAGMPNAALGLASPALGGRLALDVNGDLSMPSMYAVSRVGADGSWSSAAGGPVDGAGTCSVGLDKPSTDFGRLMPGQRSDADVQTITNSGTMAYASSGGVSMEAGMWEYAGGSAPALDRGLTKYRVQGGEGEYASLGPSMMLPGSPSLGPGGEIAVEFVLDLTSMQGFAAGDVSQTIVYTASCQ